MHWNDTKIKIKLNVSFPQLLNSPNYTNLFVSLPDDWTLDGLENLSYNFSIVGTTDLLEGAAIGLLYKSELNFFENLNLICYSTNYIAEISVPSVVTHNEVYEIRGDLLKPSLGDIHLYIRNTTILFHQITMSMMNGTFEFSMS